MSADTPSLDNLLAISKTLELSKSSAARRYVELHPDRVAVVFMQNGRVIYSVKSKSCRSLALARNQQFLTQYPTDGRKIISHEIDVEFQNGAHPKCKKTVWAETLFQQNNYAMTLIPFEDEGESQDDDED